jgi:phenylacetate-CoA ligase
LQLYGASEVGVLFMEGDDGLLHHCPETTHVELLPVKATTPGATEVAVVVVTTLDKTVQPLLRFVIGDLVQVARSGPRRYTPVAPIRSLEGRFQDALIRPDGAWVTAGSLDRAVGAVRGIQSYQANQANPSSVTIDIVPERDATPTLLDEVRARVATLLAPLEVTLRLSTGIACEGSGKFRLSRRHFTVDLGTLFEDGAERTA